MNVTEYYKALENCINKAPIEHINKAIQIIESAIENDRWVFTCGNGGSASTASHYVTDWAKMRILNTGNKFRAMCLSDNVGMITAYGNDISYDHIFEHSLENYSSAGDVLIVISGSGNSKNVVNAVKKAKELGVITICVVGYDGGRLAKICDCVVHFEAYDMQISEDMHLSFGHIVMKSLCENKFIGNE